MDLKSKQELFDNFDAEFYVARKNNIANENHVRSNAFVDDWLFDVFSEGHINGENLLDIGTGPCLHSVVYATAHFNKIYLSDLAANNRKFLEEWSHGGHGKQVSRFFEAAVKREGNVQTPTEKETELVSKIGGILRCDILQTNPLEGNWQPVPMRFDAVTTGWCINNAVRTDPEYEQVLRNICTLIKPGGYLVLMGVNDYTKSYEVNGVTYPSAYFDVDQTKKFFDTPHMKLINWKYGENVVPFGTLYNVVTRIL